MKIVIYGLARSGTTALFYEIKNALPTGAICLFEPKSFDPDTVKTNRLERLLFGRREPDVLAKVLPFRPNNPADADSFSTFEKQVLIVRDPRDRLISRLLYGVYDSDFCQRDDKISAFIQALRRKEANPRSVQLKTLLQTFAELNGESFSFEGWADIQRRYSVEMPLAFHDERRDLFLFKYEEMIDRRLEGLEEYVGVKLEGDACVPTELSRVTRTKSYDNWKDWFTAEDVEYLRPVLQPFLKRYYRGDDWELNKSPFIPAEFGSRYIERIVNDRRASLNLPPFNYSSLARV